jgi:hypothetical protein
MWAQSDHLLHVQLSKCSYFLPLIFLFTHANLPRFVTVMLCPLTLQSQSNSKWRHLQCRINRNWWKTLRCCWYWVERLGRASGLCRLNIEILWELSSEENMVYMRPAQYLPPVLDIYARHNLYGYLHAHTDPPLGASGCLQVCCCLRGRSF